MKIIVMLSSLMISAMSFAASRELSSDVYKKAAQEFLQDQAVKDTGRESIIQLLNDRKSSAQKFLAGTLKKDTKDKNTLSEEDREIASITPSYTRSFLTEENASFGAAHYYAVIVYTYHIHAIRKALGCYSNQGELKDFERSYNPQLRRIPFKDFEQKIKDSFTKDALKHLLFATSEKIADTTLTMLKNQE